MCPDLWWKTFLHTLQLASARTRSGGSGVGSRAAVASVRGAVCCLDARQRSIWWQKMDAKTEHGPEPRILTEFYSTIKMQSAASLTHVFFVLNDSPYVRTAYRNPPAAALRNLRSRHGTNWKITASRVAPARLRLQVLRLQPDHVGRTGAAGRHVTSPDAVDPAAAALIAIDRTKKRILPIAPRVSSRLCRV